MSQEEPGSGGSSLARHGDPCETPNLPRGREFLLLLSEPHIPCSIKGPGSCGSQPGMPGELHVPSPPGQLLSKPSFGAQACSRKAAFTGTGAPHGRASPHQRSHPPWGSGEEREQ